MSNHNLVAALDVAMGLLEVQQRYLQLMHAAQLEGRDVSDAELQALNDEIANKRAAWDELTGSE